MSIPGRSMALHAAEIEAGYDELLILKGITIKVAVGTIVAIVGANGSGKSTLLKTIYGLVPIRKGRIQLGDDREDIGGLPPHRLTRLGLNYVPQRSNVFPRMSVMENLEMGLLGAKVSERERFDDVMDMFPVLRHRIRQSAGTMSGGERQMLALARALLSKPKLLLLDEPSAGVAPRIVEEIFERLSALRQKLGIAILLVEQNARQALEIADYAYVLDAGVNRFEGLGNELARDPRVEEIYLGGRVLPAG